MKLKCKTIVITMGVILLLNISDLLGQDCPPIGPISTNPNNPVNTHSPAKLNYFDWTNPFYQLNWIRNGFTTSVASPFYQLNNPITNNLLDSKDMLHQDGWELITKDNGYNDNGTLAITPVTNPYVVLYNKYTGTLRVFFIIGDRQADYNSMSVKVSFFPSSGGNSYASSLLMLSSGEVKPLINPFPSTQPSFNSVNTYINDADAWFYADFPMTYDPCTCLYNSKLIITPYLSVSFSLDATGTTTGKIVDLSPSTNQVNGRLSFDNLITQGPKKVAQFFGNTALMGSYIDHAFNGDDSISATEKENVLSGVTNFLDEISRNTFLSLGLGAYTGFKEALSLFSFFTGGGKASNVQQVKIQPLAIDMSTKITGTISNTLNFQPIILKTPGSAIPANTTEEYPYYNKTLGVVTLLKAPKFGVWLNFDAVDGYREWAMLKLQEPLKILLNPAANLEIVEVEAALMFDETPGRKSYRNSTIGYVNNPSLGYYSNTTVVDDFRHFEARSEDREFTYRTDYWNLCNFYQRRFWIWDGWLGVPFANYNRDLSLKLIFHLRRKDCPPGVTCQDVLIVQKYKVDVALNDNPNISFDPYDWCLDGYNGRPYTLAEYGDEYSVNAFCQSLEYKTNRVINGFDQPLEKIKATDITENSKAKNLSTNNTVGFPNPIHKSSIFKIKYNSKNGNDVLNISLVDATGVLRKNYGKTELMGKGDHIISVMIDNYNPGTYYLKIVSKDGVTSIPLQIIP
jgi:hypothetical protein